MLLLIVLGVFVRFPAPRPNPTKRAPRLWTVRLVCCGYMILFFAFSVVLPATGMPAVAAMALMLLLFASALWRVRSWSARAGWNERHLLSVAIGVILYFTFIWGPLIEFDRTLASANGHDSGEPADRHRTVDLRPAPQAPPRPPGAGRGHVTDYRVTAPLA